MPSKPQTNNREIRIRETKVILKGSNVLQALVVLLLVLDLLLAYGIFFSQQGIFGYQQQCKHVDDLSGKIRRLKEDNNRLFRRIQSLKNDPQALEKLVRQQLGWARENELVVDFVPEK